MVTAMKNKIMEILMDMATIIIQIMIKTIGIKTMVINIRETKVN